MPTQNVLTFDQDLDRKIRLVDGGSISNVNNNGVVIKVNLYHGKEAASINGVVVGSVVCPDGGTVTLIGSHTGNTVSVTIDADCVAISGIIGLGIQVVDGTTKTTVFRIAFRVDVVETSNPVDPGSRITLQVAELIVAIEDAEASIPSDYSALLHTLAPDFSTSTAYYAGDYVWYNGVLYRFTTNHAAGSWTGADATAAVIGNDYSALSADISKLKLNLGYYIYENYYIKPNGTEGVTAGRCHTDFIFCPAGATVTFVGETDNANVSALTFYDADKHVLQTVSNIGPKTTSYTRIAPTNTCYLRVSAGDGLTPWAIVEPNLSVTLTNLYKLSGMAEHIFVSYGLPYCCNFDTENSKIIFKGVNKFVFNKRVLEIDQNTEYSYSGFSGNVLFLVYTVTTNAVSWKNALTPYDVLLIAMQKNYITRDQNAITLKHPYAIDGAVENIINFSADRTTGLVLDNTRAPYIIDGNGYTIDLGIYLTGTQSGNITTIPYSTVSGTHLYNVFVSHSESISPIRAGVYNATLFAIKNGVYTRLVPYLSQSDMQAHADSFTYDGSNIRVNCASYDSLVLVESGNSCIEVKAGVKALIKNLTIKHSWKENFLCVEGADVELENVTSIGSGAYDGFRCDSGKSRMTDCAACYNGKDGFNYNDDRSYNVNCIGSYNWDDGISHHGPDQYYEIDSCIFNYNKKGGISSPVLSAEGIAKNCICIGNHAGIYSYDSKKGIFSSIVLKNNDIRVWNGSPVYLINCVSINNGSDLSTSTIEEYPPHA